MSIPMEGISVVVRNERLESVYPGGAERFRQDCPNSTYLTDGVLSRVSFMSPFEVGLFVAHLERRGLVHRKRGKAIDFAVVDRFGGPTVRCPWLRFFDDGDWAEVSMVTP